MMMTSDPASSLFETAFAAFTAPIQAGDTDRPRPIINPGFTLTDARGHGSRHEGRLQLALDHARQGDLWRAEGAVATLWN